MVGLIIHLEGYSLSHISNDYRNLVLETINETYPKYQQERVLKAFESGCLLSEETDLLTNVEIAVDVSDIGAGELAELKKINKTITENPQSLKVIEDLEYGYSYKYATLLEINEYPPDKISELITKGHILDSSGENFSSDNCSTFAELDIIKPTYKEISPNIVALKFNEIVTGYLPVSENNKRTIKYPILALFYKDLGVLEIRFDTIKSFLKNGDDFFYVKQVGTVIDWLGKFLSVELTPLNLSPIIDFISRKESEDVDVAAQAMNLRTGSKAILDTGVDDMFVLPLLGELKKLINDNEELFKSNDKTLEIQEMLTNFIFETEETSDLPWISLRWRHQKKSRVIKVKFSFNYKGQPYDLLQYYGNNAEMERMNYVTEYLIENKREYENQEIESPEEE